MIWYINGGGFKSMSLLIKIADDSLANFIEYEKELIRSVANMNRIWIESYHPDTLCLTCLGVKYKNDGAFDQIEHISKMIQQGYGKCDSIVAWFMTMYSYMNIETEPLLINRSSKELHAQLKVYDGNKVVIIDPSVNLVKLNKEFCVKCGGNNGVFK